MAAITTEQLLKLKELKEAKREAEEAAKKAKAEYEQLQAEIFEYMRSEDIGPTSVKGYRFTPKSTIYAQVVDRDALHEWLEKNDLAEEFLRPAEEKGRLNELVRSKLENGEELPPGLGFYSKDFISISQ